MAFSNHSQASDGCENWFAKQLDLALGTSSTQQPSASSTAAKFFEPKSALHATAVGRPGADHISGSCDENDITTPGAMQYKQPRAVRPLPAGTAAGVRGQDAYFNDGSIATISPYTVPHMPGSAANHPQQPSSMIRPSTRPTWMGQEYGLGDSVHTTHLGAIPALRYHGPSKLPPSRVLQAHVPISKGQNFMPPDLIQHHSHLSSNDFAGVPARFSNFQASAGTQAPCRSQDTNSSQPSVSYGSQESSSLSFGTTAMTPASLPGSLPAASIMQQPLPATSVAASNTETFSSTNPHSSRSSISKGRGHGRVSKDFENYPPRSQPLPEGLSRREICRSYPNHLHGDILLRIVRGSGGEQRSWSGKDVWDECPADGRHCATNGRPHNYLEQRIRRADIEASESGQAVRYQERTRRSCDDVYPAEGAEDRQMSPPPNRLRLTHVSDGTS